MPTLIGIFFLIAASICFWRSDESLFALAIFSSIFQGASMTTGGSLGLQPYYVIVLLFVAQTLLMGTKGSEAAFKGRNSLLAFGAIGFLSAFTLPIVFAGIPVYDKSVGIDDGFFYRPPLTFSLSNVTQAVFLILNILFVISAARSSRKSTLAVRAFRVAFYFLVGVIICQVICATLGIPFPDEIFLNNPGYAFQDTHQGGLTLRAPGTFSESSFAGVFLSMCGAGFLADFLENGVGIVGVLLSILALFLVRSTSSFLTIPIVFIGLIVRKPIIYGSGYINIKQLRRLTILSSVIGISLVLILVSSIGQTAILSVAEKGGSSSFINRTAADIYALNVLIASKGLGVGLGSNRPSSIIASLLSNIGIAGFIAFALMYIQIVVAAKGKYAWLRWAALGLFVDMAFGVPDVGFPSLWVLLALIIHTRTMPQQSPAPG